LADGSATRIQLCGSFAVELGGRRVDQRLGRGQVRVLLAVLVLNRRRSLRRDELVDVLWDDDPPAAPGVALRALLSKVRGALGPELVAGRGEVRLELPADAWVDMEAAFAALHRADGEIARERWQAAWWPSRIALNLSRRVFLPGAAGAWVDARRRELDDLRLSAYETVAAVGLGLGRSELPAAERSARALVAEAPFRESGHGLLMRALAARGNRAEALLAYERVRRDLRDELGTVPSAALQALHRSLLGMEAADTLAPRA
jgi:SARP family transcriptional regulator, regulator of embCAB operon